MSDNMFTDYGKTEPISGMDDFNPGVMPSFNETEAISGDPFGGPAPGFGGWDTPNVEDSSPTEVTTVPIGREDAFNFSGDSGANDAGGFQFESSEPTQVVTPEGDFSFMPVVGWLVCIEGNDRGRDFRLHSGYNTIGKNADNDISIPGDGAISRERHAVIAYDQEENLYFFAPANGVNLLRLNGKVLMSPSQIKANDILTIGKTKLLFVPLCTDSFKWGDPEQ